jgi:hypothetical protein
MKSQVDGCVTVERTEPSLMAAIQAVGLKSLAGHRHALLCRSPRSLQAQNPAGNCAPINQSGECCHAWRPFVTDSWCDARKSFADKDLQSCEGRFVTAASRIANPVSPCHTRMSRMSHMSRHLKIGIGQNANHGPLHGGHADAPAFVNAAGLGRPLWPPTADWDTLRPARKKGSPQAETGRRALGKDDWLQRLIDAALFPLGWRGGAALLAEARSKLRWSPLRGID